MNNIRKLAAIALCMAVLCCLCSCSGQEPPEAPQEIREISIWCLADDPLTPGLKALAQQFNHSHPDYCVSVTEYAHEAELAEAFSGSAPDLLLCSLFTADAMYARSDSFALSSAESSPLPAYSEALRAASPCVGVSFFPIAASLPVLIVNTAAYDSSYTGANVGPAPFSSLEALCSMASAYGLNEGRPFMASDDFYRLFESFMLRRDAGFTGEQAEDIRSEDYRYIYNLLADTAFNGGLSSEKEQLLSHIGAGDIICALTDCSSLRQDDLSGLDIYPLPRISGGNSSLSARLSGLAATSRSSSAAAFIGWLFDASRAAALSLDSAMLPVYGQPAPHGSLQEYLCKAVSDPELVYSMAAGSEEFDAAFRRAMELLR